MDGETALYLYGFVSLPLPDAVSNVMRERAELRLVEADRVACVARSVRAADYDAPGSTADEQLAWVSPRAADHHGVVHRLHAADAVVPLKFGTLCPTVEDARALVRHSQAPILRLLARVRGTDEWTLAVTADTDAFARSLRASDPRLIELGGTDRPASAGRVYLVRKQVETEIGRLVDGRLAILEADLLERLAENGFEVATPHQGLAKMPLLVARDRFSALERLLAGIEATHGDLGARCELVGPWPPYSFAATLQVTGWGQEA